MAAVANHQEQLRHGQLQEDDPENKDYPRSPGECLRLVDPELDQRGREEKQCDNEILRRLDDKIAGRLGLLAAEDKKGKAGGEKRDYQNLRRCRALECEKQLVSCSPASRLFGSETAPNELTVFKEVEQGYFRLPGAGDRCC
jgi:hypothetical protein